ncbi:diguanylate cyclase [Methylomonas sp. MgM2]
MINYHVIYKHWPWYIRYPIALGLFLVALALRFVSLPAEGGLAYVTFYPVIIICFYLLGTGPGSLISVLSGLTGFYFFLPPYQSFSLSLRGYSSLPYFYLTAFLIGYAITTLHAYVDRLRNKSAQLENLQRIYAAVFETDKLISKKLEPLVLFNEVTRIAVECGGMQMAWIGKPNDLTDSIAPVSSYGEGTGYINDLWISTREDLPEGRGSTGTAFREQRTVLVQDFLKAPHTKPWHQRAKTYGWQSSACFPVMVDGKTYALLNVYGANPNVFDEEAVTLLEGIAANLGHALDEYNMEQARQQAETQLQQAKLEAETVKNRLEHLLKHAPAVMYACHASGDFGATFISENITALLGYRPRDFTDDSAFWINHIHPDDRPIILEDLKHALTGDAHLHEYRFLRKDGVYRWMQDELAIIRNSEGQLQEMVGYWIDITERREMEKTLHFRQFSLDHAEEQVYWIDRNARFIDVSENACRKLGYTRDELLKLTVADVDAVFPIEQWSNHWRELKSEGSLRFESIHKTKAGETYPTEIVANFFEYDGKEYNCALVRDITDRKQLEEQLKQRAHIDYLTGVSTRRYFMEQAELEINRSIRYDNPLSIMMLDADHFKRINDNHGHKTGDLVLKKLAETCRQSLREADMIGRMGGEEFAILLPETEQQAAIEAAERLRIAISAAKLPSDAWLPLQFTVSIGVSSLTSKGENIDVLLNLADKALYQAKKAGRNRVVTLNANGPA